MPQKVFISTTTFGQYDSAPLNQLKKAKIDVALNPHGRTVTALEIVALAKEAQGIIAGTESLSGDVLKQLKSLKVISRVGVGLDNVDMNTAKKLGIQIFSTPQGPTLAVAELVIGLIIDLLRSISLMDRQIRTGKWQKKMGALLNEKKIGIVGFGQIGQSVAQLCSAFGATIYYSDPFLKTKVSKEYISLKLPELLKEVDILTLHLSYAEENQHMIGQKELAMMKKGAYLINAARGGLVDEKALYRALKEGHLAGAAVDVFENEPYAGELKELENVILTPHIGSYAKEARIQMEREAVSNLIKGLSQHA